MAVLAVSAGNDHDREQCGRRRSGPEKIDGQPSGAYGIDESE